MKRPSLVVVAFGLIGVAATACDNPRRSVALPTTASTASSSQPLVITIPAPGPGLDNSTSIPIGQTITATLHGNDPLCDEFADPMDTSGLNGAYPCQRYRVTAPNNGVVTIRIEWPDRVDAICAAFQISHGGVRRTCVASPMSIAWTAAALQPYGFAIEFRGTLTGIDRTLSPGAAASFSVTSSQVPVVAGAVVR